MRIPSLILLLAAGTVLAHSPASDRVELAPSPDFEPAPAPSPRLAQEVSDDVAHKIDSYFESGWTTRRSHVQLDRPLYRPGETVWIKSWSVGARGLTPDPQWAVTHELVNPRGETVETKQVRQANGGAANDFTLPANAPGGKWTLKATLPTGEIEERPFVVNSYEPPRIRKTLEFVREAYGPGDEVQALIELEKTEGPLANHPVRALLQVDGETVLETEIETDATGALLVAAALPQHLSSGDGLLTVLVEDGGVTESISRSVPIVLADMQLEFFPEGGDLVADLPGRVYFSGKNRHGEPADVSGFIKDDRGREVASFSSVHDGLGRFAFTPEKGRVYTAHVTAPEGIDTAFVLPKATRDGCVLRSFDDTRSVEEAVRVAVRCSDDQQVIVTSVLRDETLDSAAVEAGPQRDTVVFLHDDALEDQQGAVRVTVFDPDLTPLAERLVYRNAGKNLNIEVTANREQYGPRDEVVLDVRTTDPSGEPVAAELALAVVDDAVLKLADDKEGHMLSRMYLEPELVDSPKDPAWYFDEDEQLAARGLDLVMGTKGYRRFEWTKVWNPPPAPTPETESLKRLGYMGYVDFALDTAEVGGQDRRPRVRLERARRMVPRAAPPAPPAVDKTVARQVHKNDNSKDAPARDRAGPGRWFNQLEDLAVAKEKAEEAFFMGDIEAPHGGGGLAAVRVFPKPDYSAGFTGVRSDFRDTVHWEPAVHTNDKGTAQVRFYLNDAITTFRVTAEGLGSGLAGHGEQTLTSMLPVSIATKLPAAVSAGDQLWLPVSVSNSRHHALDVTLAADFDSPVVQARDSRQRMKVAARGTETWWLPLDIGDGNETVPFVLTAKGGGLSDTLKKELQVVPVGFPRSWSGAGEGQRIAFSAPLDAEVVPGTLTASVTWHPSPVSTLMTGMEGLIREPGGCFEQTSSTNWPNVSILNYLEAHDGDPRLRAQSSRALNTGYKLLTGYQVDAGGFETFGNGPGKEVLSAFGLLQFTDMSRVYPVKPAVLTQDVDYLLSQRDGKGGFRNSGESAHGYGSAPKPVSDGFITYALVATGHGDDLDPEIRKQAQVSSTTDDPYVLAMATRTLVETGHPSANDAAQRLADMQAKDGSFPGAESSITRSYEANLLVESTSLAALALMAEGNRHRTEIDKAADWLIAQRQGAGTWGATQATALALQALTQHAEISRRPRTGGQLGVEVNGASVGTLSYEADQSEALVLSGFEEALQPGENDIVVRQLDGSALPFTVELAWISESPSTSPGAELSLQTSLDRTKVPMGETVRLTAHVENETGRIVPSPIARIGLPAGLDAQIWQLKQLQERGEIAFFETRPREVTLYWEGLHKDDAHDVKLDLVARVPGIYTAPASSAYPYYNDDEKAWTEGVTVEIARP